MATTNRSRREALDSLSVHASTNAGLWLDRYLTKQTELIEEDHQQARKAKEALVEQVCSIEQPKGYESCFLRRLASLRTETHDDVVRKFAMFRCVGRMVVGMGQSGVLENGIALEHTWGVPILPGPSLKGVTAAAAHALLEDDGWRKASQALPIGEYALKMFGTNEQRGAVSFLDAWWMPTAQTLPLHQDIMTPHNTSYYQGQSDVPDGQDSPIPVQFLSSSGWYLVCVAGSRTIAEQGWLDAALQILELGLQRLGIGAKTNAGYGRMVRIDNEDDPWFQLVFPPKPPTPKEEAQTRYNHLAVQQVESEVKALLDKPTEHWSELEQHLFELIIAQHLEQWRQGKSNSQTGAKNLKSLARRIDEHLNPPGALDVEPQPNVDVVEPWANRTLLANIVKAPENMLKQAIKEAVNQCEEEHLAGMTWSVPEVRWLKAQFESTKFKRGDKKWVKAKKTFFRDLNLTDE